MLIADVALPVPLARAYSYEVPPALAGVLAPGDRVVCPFAGPAAVAVSCWRCARRSAESLERRRG